MLKAGDVAVIALLAAFNAFAYGWYADRGAAGDRARVTVSGDDRVLRFELEPARQVRLAGPLGVSVLEIGGGRARFLDSPCPGKYCIHSGWLSRSGDYAACLPNGIGLLIERGETWDSINY